MLQVAYLRENTQEAIDRLAKRNLDSKTTILEILALDDARRGSQSELDNLLAETKTISKEIGELFKSGKRDQADSLKLRTIEIKELTKVLEEKIAQTEETLKNLLLTLPNTPSASVKKAKHPKTTKPFLNMVWLRHSILNPCPIGTLQKNMTSLILNWV